MFYSDISIDNEDDDVLNRSEFAKKLANSILEYDDNNNPLTIGLIGKWGSGKTSLINLTVKNINQDDYLIIHFNPWFYSNQNNLYLQFFKLLLNEFKDKQDDTGNAIGRKLKHIKTMFHQSITETLQNYYDYIKSNSSINLKIDDIGLSLSNTEESYGSMVFHKKQCDIYFEKLDFKVLMIIDDIDRLVDEEIKQVFTLVKSLADFPNFVYLLAFDKNVVAKSLDNIHSDHAYDFMNKIIQIPISIPEISESKLNELIMTNIGPIYTEHLEKSSINAVDEFSELSKYLNIFIKDIRDLKRFINILDFYLDIFAEELNINDFFLILAIQLFEYKLYLKIKENKDVLTVNRLVFSRETVHINTAKNVKNELEKSIISTNKVRIMNLLTILFPVLNIGNHNPHYKPNYDNLRRNHRLCSDIYFEKYYTLSLESNEVSTSLLNKLIQLDDVDEICNILTYSDDLDYNHSLLTQFRELISKIPTDNIEIFIKAIMKCGDNIETYSTTRRTIEWILSDLTRKLNDKYKCFDILKECIAYDNNTLTVCEYIYSLAFDYGLAGSNKLVKSENLMPVDIEQVKQLITLTVAKIRKESDNEEFINHKFLQDILSYWELLDNKGIVKEYVLRKVNTDEELISFLSKFRTVQKTTHSLRGGNSKSRMVFDLKKLDAYHGLEFYEERVNRILLKEDLKLEDKMLCELFNEQLKEY